jgi:hypothetical protein
VTPASGLIRTPAARESADRANRHVVIAQHLAREANADRSLAVSICRSATVIRVGSPETNSMRHVVHRAFRRKRAGCPRVHPASMASTSRFPSSTSTVPNPSTVNFGTSGFSLVGEHAIIQNRSGFSYRLANLQPRISSAFATAGFAVLSILALALGRRQRRHLPRIRCGAASSAPASRGGSIMMPWEYSLDIQQRLVRPTAVVTGRLC